MSSVGQGKFRGAVEPFCGLAELTGMDARGFLQTDRAVEFEPVERPANLDGLALLIEAIASEAAELATADRETLAERVLRLGGYEVVGEDGWAAAQSARARFAAGLAARLRR